MLKGLKGIDRIIAPSEFSARLLEDNGYKNIHTVPNGIPDRYKGITNKSEEKLEFLFIGHAPHKGIDLIEKAIPYIDFDNREAYWESGHDKNKSWLDIVLYSGEKRQLNLTKINNAAIGILLQIDTKSDMEDKVSVEADQNMCRLNFDQMTLQFPTRPQEKKALQAFNKKFIH